MVSTDVETPLPPPLRHRPSDEALDQDFELGEAFVAEVTTALRSGDKERVRLLVAFLHYADMADLLERLDTEDRRLLIEATRDVFNPDVLPELAT